tara:strand:- start:4899 stop:5816 length:918 start_codon:yes stop_codon:yes gene_type:complete
MNSYNGLHILITGGTGYIGSALISSLKEYNCTVHLSKGDVSKKETWSNIITDKIDIIFHLAAVEVGHEVAERDLNVNSVAVLHMLQTCVEKKYNPKIIFSSSTNLFGDVKEDVVDEQTQSSPPAEWAAHKLLAENYLRIHSKKYGLKTITLRLPNVYGPVLNIKSLDRKTSGTLISRVIKYGLEHKKLKLFGNKDCLRDYIFIDDIVNAFIKAGLALDKFYDGRFFVIGSNKFVTISDMWNIMAKNIEATISVDSSYELNPIEMRSYVGNYSQFNKITGWQPETNIQDGIMAAVKNIKEHVYETK